LTRPTSPVPPALIRRILETLSETPDSQTAFRRLAGEMDGLWPDAAMVGRAIRDAVETDGIAVADDLGINDTAPEVRDVLLLAVLAHIGRITAHDDTVGRVLWDIKDRAACLGDRQPTFSERRGECPVHTDSAFAELPEKYLCLYVVRQSPDGGGESVIIPMKAALKQLEAEPDGIRCVATLRQDGFPHRTPNAFSSVEKVVVSPILARDPAVRFRYDSIIDGFATRPDLATPERRWAVDHFFEFVEQRAERLQFLATTGQLVVLDNLSALHARTDYQDPSRHLIRARLLPHAKTFATVPDHRADSPITT
jgi:alpha-ketoglutarate-dependent taurine dioxygenase